MPGRGGVVPVCAVGEHLDSVGGDGRDAGYPEVVVGGGQPASLGEVGRRDVPLGRTQGGHAHVEGIGALLDLDLPVGLVGEFREAGILGEALT